MCLAVQHLPTIKDKCALAGLLRGQVLKYVLDSHGNHVVQCCFRHIRDREGDDSIDFMLEASNPFTVPAGLHSGTECSLLNQARAQLVHGVSC